MINPRVTHVAIDGALFQAEVEARKVMAVPTVLLNGAEFSQGRVSLEMCIRDRRQIEGDARKELARFHIVKLLRLADVATLLEEIGGDGGNNPRTINAGKGQYVTWLRHFSEILEAMTGSSLL